MKRFATLLLAGLLGSIGAQAQTWPAKPVNVIVGYAPGGGADRMVRLMAEELGKRLGQSFVVENRGGAGGAVGAAAAAQAVPDGYTIYGGGNPELTLVPLAQKVSYRPFEDLAILSIAAQSPTVLVVPAASPIKDAAAWVAAGKQDKGITVATPGNGTPNHLLLELFNARMNAKLVHVGYKGGGPAATDVLGGQVDSGAINAPPVLPHLQSGRMRALAVFGATRSGLMPDVPTLKEVTGFGETQATSSFLFATPASVPQAIRDKLEATIREVAQTPDMKAKLAQIGMEPTAFSSAQSIALLKEEMAAYDRIIKQFKVKMD